MSDVENPPLQRKIFRVELRVGKGENEVVLPLYASALEGDVTCKGHLIFTPETPLRYRYEEGTSFIAQKMSVPSTEIAGWQEGVLIANTVAEPAPAPEVETVTPPEPTPEPTPVAATEPVPTPASPPKSTSHSKAKPKA